MKKIGYIVLFLCLGTGLLWADERNKPGFQIEDNTFFDPTRKDENKEKYEFGVEYRVEAGFVQHWQRVRNISYPDMYLNGVRLGATFTFKLPLRFGLQTGLLYTLVYGKNEQHWRSQDAPSVQTEYLKHRVLEHNFTVPIRAYYTIPVWKKMNIFFYAGPQLQICLAENDYIDQHLSVGTKAWLEGQGIPVEPYNRIDKDHKELWPINIQMGLGAGLEWDCYRLQGGYDFGLNNRIRQKQTSGQYMSEWGWMVTFSYRF